MVSAEQVRSLLDYDRITGNFVWRVRDGADRATKIWNTRYAGKTAGTVMVSGYVTISIAKKRYLAHRLAWLHFYGEHPPEFIDHIDCRKDNNAVANLRCATKAQNMQNRSANRNNKSGFKGVSWAKANKKWQSHIGVSGKGLFLGFFDTPESAAEAYAIAARELHGEFGRAS